MNARPLRFSSVIVFLVLGLLLGALPPVASHLLTTFQLLPSSPWDSRPCHGHPGPDTCDGILPSAPRDLRSSSSSPIPGSAGCIDQYAKQFSAQITDTFGHQSGEVTLWWLPSCSSHFGYAYYAGDYHNGIRLAVQLSRYPKASR